jgi:parvulin-like peptidyl-prolyl isomerase
MAAEVAREVLTKEEEYADAEYRRFLKEKDKYIDFDEFCRQEGI